MSESTSSPATADADSRSDEELRQVLRTRTDPLVALRQGAELMTAGLGPGLGIAVLYAAGGALGGAAAIEWATGLLDTPPTSGSGAVLSQGLLVAVVFLAAYTGIQFSKRETASRTSWVPVVFTAPALCAYGAMAAASSPTVPPPVVPALATYAWDLLYDSFVGAFALFVWLRLGDAAMKGRTAALPEIWEDVRARYLDVVTVHAARYQAVAIGMQVIVPGIFYALQLAFAEQIAVLDPQRKALRRSGQLTFGMRGRLFRLLLVVFLVGAAGSIGGFVLVDGIPEDSGLGGRITELLMNPAAPSGLAMFVQRLVGSLTVWITALAMLVLYREREAQVRAKRALRDRQRAEDGSGKA